ncbi:MAG: hypothetical protein R3C58_15510 [Parvularculaceae bacterium]
MSAGNLSARIGVIAGMTLIVIGLMRLTTPAHVSAGADKTQMIDPVLAMADHWNGEINYAPAYSALDPSVTAAAHGAASKFDPSDDYWGLPRSDGHEIVAGYCSACHTLQIVMQQHQSEDGWNSLLDWMIEKQGMAAPDDATRAEIVSYLAREFGQ